MSFLYATSTDSDDARENLEPEEEEAASDAAANDSDQLEWDDIYESFRWRDGKILLMTFGGGPSGGWATDATGNLWKRRRRWRGSDGVSLGVAGQDCARSPRHPHER